MKTAAGIVALRVLWPGIQCALPYVAAVGNGYDLISSSGRSNAAVAESRASGLDEKAFAIADAGPVMQQVPT